MATTSGELPKVIQGGMGVGVSGWRLARAVGRAGQLGVVSGTALDALLTRRLQIGDPGGDVRRALAAFPVPELATAVLDRFYVEGGVAAGERFRAQPMLRAERGELAELLTVLGNFVEVWLAKEGHRAPVGINYLEKIQLGLAPGLFGAILAGVDCVLVGAGVPGHVPEMTRRLARMQPVSTHIRLDGAQEDYVHSFDPAALLGRTALGAEQGCQCEGEDGGGGEEAGCRRKLPADGQRQVQDVRIESLVPAVRSSTTPNPPATRAMGLAGPLRCPHVLAIVSLPLLASYLARDEATTPDGFVIETHGAGGHSAPPRGALQLDAEGEPVYGPRDHPDLAKMAKIGIPFWLAGGAAHPERLAAARALGAAGVQVGSAFALCEESGLEPGLRLALRARAHAKELKVRNDPLASPTAFPFKVAELPGTLSDPAVRTARRRVCDLGYLRAPYRTAGGAIGYRCSAEPEAAYRRKGGSDADTEDRLCLCNGLLATVGLGQRHPRGQDEPPVLTLGQDLDFLSDLSPDGGPYRAVEVVEWMTGGRAAATAG
ncbi:nitronate monooxygenase [Streptomyces sp. NBC_01283]|uniref:nitronate monooxygenase n=1 Tax=Streptomyces sp. NBC_01283 TaxID=2903812 RepID=UPI00352C977E|nr:nitronate monooxygenase [Streptomyces sp. NBC_01283]